MKKNLLLIAIAAMFAMQSCLKTDELWGGIDDLKNKIAALESKVGILNDNTQALYELKKKDVVICGVTPTSRGYKIEFSDGKTIAIAMDEDLPAFVPTIGIDAEGFWIYSIDAGLTFTRLLVDDEPVSAYPSYDGEPEGFAPMVKVDADGYWLVSYDNGVSYSKILRNKKPIMAQGSNVTYSGFFDDVTFDKDKGYLDIKLLDGTKLSFLVKDDFGIRIGAPTPDIYMANEERFYEVEQYGVAQAVVIAPRGWTATLEQTLLTVKSPAVVSVASEEVVSIVVTSAKGYIRSVPLKVKVTTEAYDANAAVAWNNFKAANANNVLLDFSYAGYKRGEVSIPDVWSLGLKVFNVKDYGATPNDLISDREAFKAAAIAAEANKGGIIYFPRGKYILHDDSDNTNSGTTSEAIFIRSSNIIIKGDGRDESIIEMVTGNKPSDLADPNSIPPLIQIKHNSAVTATPITTITADAAKGSFTLSVANTGGLSVGSWVCLRMINKTQAVIDAELAPHSFNSTWTDMSTNGVRVDEFHQIKSKASNSVTFFEPIMYDVKTANGWGIHAYSNYTNVGVEDLGFLGHCKNAFVHHGTPEDDYAFRPIDFFRLTDSWIRRVKFVNVSEGSTVSTSANVTVADVIIEGTQGHAAIRSAGSTRVFIGKVVDRSDKTSGEGTILTAKSGQWHAVGVSKPSMGAVLWNNDWGVESCFEVHATQPRATLFDICTGGFMDGRGGGAIDQLPNHLGDFTMWNFVSTNIVASDFKWWNGDTDWKLKILPPTIVGFQGSGTTPFTDATPTQIKYIESSGTPVGPHSLYEAQLRRRLGFVPAWLNALK